MEKESVSPRRTESFHSVSSSFSSSSVSSSTRSRDSFDFGGRPLVSEYEEIPSIRWLQAIFVQSNTNLPPPSEGDGKTRHPHETMLDLFQTRVADRFRSLASDDGKLKHDQQQPLISLSFLHKLLDTFLCVEEEFRALLPELLGQGLRRRPTDRLVADLLERAVRWLDVCNAVTEALDSLTFCKRYAEIAASALQQPLEQNRFVRASRALSNLLDFLIPDDRLKESSWSFRRNSGSVHSPTVGEHRWCFSLDVSPNWSAEKEMQSMWANLVPPRDADATVAICTMSAVMVFVMWVLVVAFSCQDRGMHGSSAIATTARKFLAAPWQLPWAVPMVVLQERIVEEWKRGRRPGLLVELQSLVRCGRVVVDMGGGGAPVFPLDEWQWEEVGNVGWELAATCRSMEEELGPLRRQVKEVFNRAVLSRAEVMAFQYVEQKS